MTICIRRDTFGDTYVYSDDEKLVGQWVELLFDDDDNESDTVIMPNGGSFDDQIRVNTDSVKIKRKDFEIQDWEDEPEEEEEKTKFKHHFICPSCHHMWQRENSLPVGEYTDYCPKAECTNDDELMPYKTDELEDA